MTLIISSYQIIIIMAIYTIVIVSRIVFVAILAIVLTVRTSSSPTITRLTSTFPAVLSWSRPTVFVRQSITIYSIFGISISRCCLLSRLGLWPTSSMRPRSRFLFSFDASRPRSGVAFLALFSWSWAWTRSLSGLAISTLSRVTSVTWSRSRTTVTWSSVTTTASRARS